MRLKTEGGELAYEAEGTGPAVMFLHAFPLGLAMWDAQAAALRDGHQVLRFDARGFGDSDLGEGPLTMERIADDAVALLDHLGLAKAVVVGCSMGGYAALALWERHTSTVHSLALVDTRASADTPEGKAGRTAAMQNVLERGRRWLAEQMVPKLVAQNCDALVRARVQTMIEALPVETILADLEGMRERKNRRVVLPQLALPVLVVVGALDVITPPSDAEAMQKEIPGAQLAVIPDAGHLVPMEAPAAFAAELGRFWGCPTE